MPPGQALQKAGMTLVMKVGGASGPLYGSLLMGIGKSLAGASQSGAPSLFEIADALQAGVDTVRQRGKSAVGDKTMLDVLVPVCEALRDGASQPLPVPRLLDALSAAAGRGLEATRALQARKGRASFLAERSVGHLDPGARSSQLIVECVCTSLRGEGMSASAARAKRRRRHRVALAARRPRRARTWCARWSARAFPLASCGGNPDGGLGTDVAAISAAGRHRVVGTRGGGAGGSRRGGDEHGDGNRDARRAPPPSCHDLHTPPSWRER